MGKLLEINKALTEMADMLRELEPNQQVFMIIGLVEELDEPADTTDGLVRGVRDALTERLALGEW